METKKTAVIILSWNALPLLKEYLPTVVQSIPSEEADILLADNGSTDGSADFARSLGVEVIPLERNFGFAEGYNRAIKGLWDSGRRYPYTLLLNNDVRVQGHWLEPLVWQLEQNPATVAVQPTILSDRDHNLFEYAGAMGGYLDLLGYPFCRGRIFGTIEPFQTDGKPTYRVYPAPVFWATGACMLIRTEAYIDAGGFDASFFAHQEEIDLAWRLHRKGFSMTVVPSSVVYHLGGGTLSSSNPHKTFLNFRNNLLMLRKNLPSAYGIRSLTLIVRFFLDFVAALSFLPHRNGPKEALAVAKAWRANLKTRVPRSKEDEAGKRQAYGKLYPHSLLVRYNLFGEKTYSRLKL